MSVAHTRFPRVSWDGNSACLYHSPLHLQGLAGDGVTDLIVSWRKKLWDPRAFNSSLINYPTVWSRWQWQLPLPTPHLLWPPEEAGALFWLPPLTLLSKPEILVTHIFHVCSLLWIQRNLSYLPCHLSFTFGNVLWKLLILYLGGQRWGRG